MDVKNSLSGGSVLVSTEDKVTCVIQHNFVKRTGEKAQATVENAVLWLAHRQVKTVAGGRRRTRMMRGLGHK